MEEVRRIKTRLSRSQTRRFLFGIEPLFGIGNWMPWPSVRMQCKRDPLYSRRTLGRRRRQGSHGKNRHGRVGVHIDSRATSRLGEVYGGHSASSFGAPHAPPQPLPSNASLAARMLAACAQRLRCRRGYPRCSPTHKRLARIIPRARATSSFSTWTAASARSIRSIISRCLSGFPWPRSAFDLSGRADAVRQCGPRHDVAVAVSAPWPIGPLGQRIVPACRPACG